MHHYIETSTNFMGFDFILSATFSITYLGHPGRTYGPPEFCFPPEPPEFEIESITLQLDAPGSYPEFKATGKLFQVLANSRAIDDAVLEAIEEAEHAPEYDEDLARDR